MQNLSQCFIFTPRIPSLTMKFLEGFVYVVAYFFVAIFYYYSCYVHQPLANHTPEVANPVAEVPNPVEEVANPVLEVANPTVSVTGDEYCQALIQFEGSRCANGFCTFGNGIESEYSCSESAIN